MTLISVAQEDEEQADWHYMADVEDASDKDLFSDDDDDFDNIPAVGSYWHFLIDTLVGMRRRLVARSKPHVTRIVLHPRSLHVNPCYCKIRTWTTLALVFALSL